MTLVAIRNRPDRIEVMTDSIACAFDSRRAWVDEEPKTTVLDGLNAVLACRGNAAIGQVWAQLAAKRAAEASDFDEFMQRAPATLHAVMQVAENRPTIQRIAKIDPLASSFHAFMAGWSPERGRFVAYVATDHDDFMPTELDGFHVAPTPTGCQPTDGERRVYERLGRPLPDGSPAPEPTTTEEWVHLARRIHRTRAVRKDMGLQADPWHVAIGGPVHLTVLTPDASPTREQIHTFTAADFQAVFKGTFHPVGQLGPCPCGSTRRFLDCHIDQWRGLPCHCGSGDTLAACCMLDVNSTEALEAFANYPELAPAPVVKAGRNDPCPCGSGRKYKACHALADAGV